MSSGAGSQALKPGLSACAGPLLCMPVLVKDSSLVDSWGDPAICQILKGWNFLWGSSTAGDLHCGCDLSVWVSWARRRGTASLVAGSYFFYYFDVIVVSCKKYEFYAYPSFSSPMVTTHRNTEQYHSQDIDLCRVRQRNSFTLMRIAPTATLLCPNPWQLLPV